MALALRLAFALLILPLCAPIGARAAAWSNNLELPAAAPLVDEANLLSASETAQLSELLRTIKARSGVEVSVFIASSLRERPIEDLSLAVAEKWGLGTKKVDKGLLFLVAPNEKKMRFEVGYGLEGDITDAFSRQVLDNRVRPLFREGRYYEGILSGIQGIQEKVPLGLAEEQAPRPRRGGGNVNFIFFLLIMVFMVMGFISRLLGGGGSRRGGGFGGPFIG
ncbi:MAG: TPM domain-containing protein, partial [Proteobacteria bacterium]